MSESPYQVGENLQPQGSGVWENRTSGTGRTPTSDPLLDRCNLGLEGSGPMAIMPTADSSVTPAPPLPESLIDGCPSCVVNVEAPSSVYRAGHSAHLANYVCLDCGHAWSTSWGV